MGSSTLGVRERERLYSRRRDVVIRAMVRESARAEGTIMKSCLVLAVAALQSLVLVWGPVADVAAQPRSTAPPKTDASPARGDASAPRPDASAPKPEGEMRWALYVTLAPQWFDPSDVLGQITPFWVLYAIHDALVKPMPGNLMTPSLAESWT